MAVVSATRRPNAVSPRSWISWGLGPSTSAIRGAGAPPDLLAHGVAAGLERVHEALRLLFEELAALVQPLAGAALRLVGQVLRPARHVAAALGQELARLGSGPRRQQDRDARAEHRPEQEPAHVPAGIASLVTHGGLLGA